MERREWFEIVMITLLSFGVIGLLLKGNQQQAELTLLKQNPSATTTQTETIKTELPNSLQAVLDSLTNRVNTLETTEPDTVPAGQGGMSTTTTTGTASFQPQTIYLGQAATSEQSWTET